MGVDVDACNRILADRSAAAPSYAVQPTFLKAVVLRPHQLDGLNFLIFMHQAGRNALLADDMGLGKTLQLLSFLAWHKEKNPARVATPRYCMSKLQVVGIV
jgi:SNF2 family DNA or RNA helicase